MIFVFIHDNYHVYQRYLSCLFIIFITFINNTYHNLSHLFVMYHIYSRYLSHLFTILIMFLHDSYHVYSQSITFICDVSHVFTVYHEYSPSFTIFRGISRSFAKIFFYDVLSRLLITICNTYCIYLVMKYCKTITILLTLYFAPFRFTSKLCAFVTFIFQCNCIMQYNVAFCLYLQCDLHLRH